MFDTKKFLVPKEKLPRATSTEVEVRKPGTDEVIRCHLEWRLEGVAVLELSNSSYYVLTSELVDEFVDSVKFVDLVPTCSAEGELFLWPVVRKQKTARECAEAARQGWQKFAWNAKTREYEVVARKDVKTEANWRFESFDELLAEALEGRAIESREHEVLVKLAEKSAEAR